MSAMIYVNGAWKEADTPKVYQNGAFVDTEGKCWVDGIQKEAWGDRWIIKNGVMQEPFKSATMYQARTGHNILSWDNARITYTSDNLSYGGSVLINHGIKGTYSYLYADFTVLRQITDGANCTIALTNNNSSTYDTNRKGIFTGNGISVGNHKFYTTASYSGTFYLVIAGYSSEVQYNNILLSNKVLSGYTHTEPHS